MALALPVACRRLASVPRIGFRPGSLTDDKPLASYTGAAACAAPSMVEGGAKVGASMAVGEEDLTMSNASATSWSAWAQMMTVVVAVVGAAWGLAWSFGGNFERLGAAVERNAQAIERSAKAIGRNAGSHTAALGRLQAAVGANRAIMAENTAATARLAGQYAEHVRRHDGAARR